MLKRGKYRFFCFLGLLVFFVVFPAKTRAQEGKTTIYLFPGQGSDERIFSEFKPDSNFRLVSIKYPIPEKGTSLSDFAKQMIPQIDTSSPYIFIGVSLGGMISIELNEIMRPEKVIIISSAKCRDELPFRYKFQKTVPLYKLVPKGMIKMGARVLQPIVEPDRKKNKSTFKSMLKSKDKKYLKRTVAMIIKWDRKTYSDKIIHIHGTKDHTLPYRKVKSDYTIKKGSHMMTLTRGEEINVLLNEILNSKK